MNPEHIYEKLAQAWIFVVILIVLVLVNCESVLTSILVGVCVSSILHIMSVRPVDAGDGDDGGEDDVGEAGEDDDDDEDHTSRLYMQDEAGDDLLAGVSHFDGGAPGVYESGPGPAPAAYPGAIEVDDPSAPGEFAMYGHRDRGLDDFNPLGNPYTVGRIAQPKEVVCIDEDAEPIHDGDELNVVHSLARNDATRVAAGIIRRGELVDRYLREELDEAEERTWYHRHEY